MFKHFDLRLPTPTFKDPIVGMIIELEKLRGNQINPGVNRKIFNQLKEVFHTVESIYSARIEGNRTTISDYVQDKTEGKRETQSLKEIVNIERALRFIDVCFKDSPEQKIDAAFLSHLHGLITEDLDPCREGSHTPGIYRTTDVAIKNAEFCPPLNVKVPEYMQELLNFIDADTDLQDELLKVAVAHHRFVWIHPFDNGNGRMSRVLTYAMLKKARFDKISLLNTVAVFCINREQYFENLAQADSGEEDGLLKWCRFVLFGLLKELIKLRKLLDTNFLKNDILKPAIEYIRQRELITADEAEVLKLSISESDNLIMSKDISAALSHKTPRQITYLINKMVENELLQKEDLSGRKYLINLLHHHVMRGIIEYLSREGFIEDCPSGE